MSLHLKIWSRLSINNNIKKLKINTYTSKSLKKKLINN